MEISTTHGGPQSEEARARVTASALAARNDERDGCRARVAPV
ncbi:MAG: hypothetical protein JWM95_1918 [Gemmatimonadetes bacterium]|nr:hypothetical protein [Gemmatimonadota bacterium]